MKAFTRLSPNQTHVTRPFEMTLTPCAEAPADRYLNSVLRQRYKTSDLSWLWLLRICTLEHCNWFTCLLWWSVYLIRGTVHQRKNVCNARRLTPLPTGGRRAINKIYHHAADQTGFKREKFISKVVKATDHQKHTEEVTLGSPVLWE